jgi:hypothetical protein
LVTGGTIGSGTFTSSFMVFGTSRATILERGWRWKFAVRRSRSGERSPERACPGRARLRSLFPA